MACITRGGEPLKLPVSSASSMLLRLLARRLLPPLAGRLLLLAEELLLLLLAPSPASPLWAARRAAFLQSVHAARLAWPCAAI